MKRKATVKARTPGEFERWRKVAEEVRRKKQTATTPTTNGAKNEF